MLQPLSPITYPRSRDWHGAAILCTAHLAASLAKIESAAMDLLQHLSLLFIPAGVGIMVSYTQVGAAWFAVLASMLISTLLTMAVVALSFQYFQSNAQQPSDLHRGEAEEQQDHQDHQGVP